MAERLGEWAKRKRIHPKTAYKMFVEGRIPVPVERFSERVILVHDPSYNPDVIIKGQVVVYARVSSSDQQEDLDRQVLRILEESVKRGYAIDEVVKEVGSGLNDKRVKLNGILSKPTVQTIIVEHRERLTRFGFEMLQSSLKAQGRHIIVLNDNEVEDDIVRDMTEILTSLCARLYGKRSAKNRAARAMKKLKEAPESKL